MTHDARSKRRRVFAAATVVTSTLLALVLAELAAGAWLRRDSGLPDYGETWRAGGLGPGGYLREGFTADVGGERGPVRWHNNAQGFRYDRELVEPKPAGTVRVLVLGDSFAAGFRTGQTETYASRLEQGLRAEGLAAEVPIAVIEEPVTGLYWLQRWGLRWQPDLVLLGVCLGNDIAQAFVALDPRGTHSLTIDGASVVITPQQPADPLGFRHGLEACALPASALIDEPPARLPHNRTPHLIELLFGPGRRAIGSFYGPRDPHRLFDVHNGLGMFLREVPPPIATAYERLGRALDGYQVLCNSHGVKFAVLLCAQRYQVQPADWQVTADGYGLRPEAFDLDLPNHWIGEHCRKRGIVCLDPTPDLQRGHREQGVECYFAGSDMHWNAAGHEAAAGAIRDRVRQLLAR
ncbi:MAG: hypothetical protein WAT39_12745 [Planctomycetota bacterium]